MSNANEPNKLAFSTRCLPGSAAELQETERLAEFQRAKTLRKAQEALDKPERDAQRNQEYETAFEAHKTLMRKKRPTWAPREQTVVKPTGR